MAHEVRISSEDGDLAHREESLCLLVFAVRVAHLQCLTLFRSRASIILVLALALTYLYSTLSAD